MSDFKSKILAANDLATKVIPGGVPEWGFPEGSLSIRTMMGEERESFETMLMAQRNGDDDIDPRGIRTKLVVLTLVDTESGNRVFEEGDEAALGKKSSLVINRLAEMAQEANGIATKSVENLAKNSEGGQPAASTSD